MLGRRNYAINHGQISAPFSYDGSLFFNVDFFGFHYSYFEDEEKMFQFWKDFDFFLGCFQSLDSVMIS